MKKFYFLFIVLSLGVSTLHGQSVDDLEAQYRLLNLSIRKEQAVTDSLNVLMENTARDVALEKKSSSPDQNKIVKWMSHAVTVSDQIKAHQKEITKLQSSAEEWRERIERVCTKAIDSLRELESSKRFEGDKKVLQNEILYWTEKRVLLSPIVGILTFDPKKVQEINLENATDPLDRLIVEDYLKKALQEIDVHLQRVALTRKEYEEITDLRKRTTEFVNEAYEQGRINTITRSQIVAAVGGSSIGDPGTPTEFTTVQFRSVVGLIQQLNTGMLISPAGTTSIPSKPGITQEEYIQLLKQAERQLKAYREIVQKKLK